jgi:hypothetical protein
MGPDMATMDRREGEFRDDMGRDGMREGQGPPEMEYPEGMYPCKDL